jgi:hypothetical protein
MTVSTRSSPLGPDETIQKFLISTTSRFVGAHLSESLELQHAWPGVGDYAASRRLDPGPTSRSAYVVLFRTDPLRKQVGAMIPTYEHIPQAVIAYLSVLFGKRFDNHGSIEWSGMFGIPNMAAFSTTCVPELPWNTHSPRPDLQIPLNLTEYGRFEPMFRRADQHPEQLEAFVAAARFYVRALQAAETDEEVAYLHLITTGEVLANATEHDFDSLLDAETSQDLRAIEDGLANGIRIAKRLRGRLRQIKRRFVATLSDLVDPSFFTRTEAREPYAGLKAVAFDKVLAAAYDLRSRHVHSGARFGGWIGPTGNMWLSEVQVGRPVVDDADWAKTLASAPTLVGLERIIRYCLLQFAGRLGADISVRPVEA